MTHLFETNKSRTAAIGYLFILLSFLALFQYRSSSAQSTYNCSSAYQIDETLPNNSRWEMCWEHRVNEGIVLHDVFYTTPEGTRRLVLAQAAVSQIHVPYDDNGARFHDVSDYGMGNYNMNDLTPSDCPNGTLLDYNGKDVICQQVQDRGYVYKSYSRQLQGHSLNLFSVSHIGAYNYIPNWEFMDDGTIVPSIGATGRLQRRGTNSDHGWPIDSGNSSYGISHLHNYYWRLDFDIDGENDDLVEQISYSLNDSKTKYTQSIEAITTEAERQVDPEGLRFWRVRDKVTVNEDGHAISSQIDPIRQGHIHRGPANEPFTQNDFYVTLANSCERFASHNPTTNNCGEDVSEFVNGENVDGQDVVIWYGMTFHHVPRDEDEPEMHTHWDGFEIIPRDWTGTTQFPAVATATTPTATAVPPTATPSVGNGLVPVAGDDSYTATQDEAFSAYICNNDTEGDGYVWDSMTIISGGVTGLSLSNCSLTGTPTDCGVQSFVYQYADNNGDTAQATVTIDVQCGVTDLTPTAGDDAYTATVGTSFSAYICGNDTEGDGYQWNSMSIMSGDVPGLSLNNCNLTGAPTQAGTFAFTYEFSDVDGDTAQATVTMTVQ